MNFHLQEIPLINQEDLTDFVDSWNEYAEHLMSVFGDDSNI